MIGLDFYLPGQGVGLEVTLYGVKENKVAVICQRKLDSNNVKKGLHF